MPLESLSGLVLHMMAGRRERKASPEGQCALSKDGTCCFVVAQGCGLTDRERSDTLNLETSRCIAGSGRQRPRRWTIPEAKNNNVCRTANSWATRSEPVGLYQGALHKGGQPLGSTVGHLQGLLCLIQRIPT